MENNLPALEYSWSYYTYIRPVTYSSDPQTNSFSIATTSDRARGSWMCRVDTLLVPEATYYVAGDSNGLGKVVVVWYDARQRVISTPAVQLNENFSAPANAAKMRLDLRFWDKQGKATWDNIRLHWFMEEIEPPVTLPIPEKLELDRVDITGYKWDNIYFLVDHSPDGIPLPPVNGSATKVQGYRHGRDITLTITWPMDDIDPNEPADLLS